MTLNVYLVSIADGFKPAFALLFLLNYVVRVCLPNNLTLVTILQDIPFLNLASRQN